MRTCHTWFVEERLNLNSVSRLKLLHTLNYPDSSQLTSNIPHLSSHINHHSSLTPPDPSSLNPSSLNPPSLTPHHLPLITHPSSLTPHRSPLITHHSPLITNPSSLTHHQNLQKSPCFAYFCQIDAWIKTICCFFNQKCEFSVIRSVF